MPGPHLHTPLDLAREIDPNVRGTIIMQDTVGKIQFGSGATSIEVAYNPTQLALEFKLNGGAYYRFFTSLVSYVQMYGGAAPTVLVAGTGGTGFYCSCAPAGGSLSAFANRVRLGFGYPLTFEGNAEYGRFDGTHPGTFTLTPYAVSTGTPNLFVLNATNATHTALANESVDVKWNLSRLVTFSAPVASQRVITIEPPTYASSTGGAITIGTAATLAITGAPVAGTDMTFTRSWALWVDSGQSSFPVGSAAAPSIAFGTDSDTGLYHPNANVIGWATAGTARGYVGALGEVFLQPGAEAGPGAFSIFFLDGAGATHTNQSSESIDVLIRLGRVVTFSPASVPATQRAFHITAPTYASAGGAQIIATAATLSISGAPAAGALMTLTNSYALWVQSGASRIPVLHTGGGTVQFNDGSAFFLNVYTSGGAWRVESDYPFQLRTTLANAPITFHTFNTLRGTIDGAAGHWTLAPGAGGTGVYNLFNLNGTGATHANITAESSDVYLNLNRTVGASSMATQRAVLIAAPTYAGAAPAQTIATAATLAISGAPAVGTNMAITNSYALWVQAGDSKFGGKIIPASPQTYNITNVTTRRSLDADATTIDELADALGTLVADLRAIGSVL